MPNPWKKLRAGAGAGAGGGGVSRLLAGLRPPEQGGSLVVQTGFPTSLADLVVKNRGRLKKHSRKKKSPPSDLDSAASDPVPSPAAVASVLDCGPRPGAAFAGRPVTAAEDGSPSSLGATKTARRRFGTGFELLSVMTLVLVVLSIERKKLVEGITVSTFALRLLDSMGLQVLRFLKPCSDAKRRLNSVVGGWELEGRGAVSPIREVGIDSCSDTVRSERNSVESTDLDEGREVLLEKRDLAEAGKVYFDRDLGSKGNSKAKKLFRKFFPKKFRRRRDSKHGEELIPDSSGRGVFDGITEIEEEASDRVDDEASNRVDDDAEITSGDVLSINASNEATDHDTEDMKFIQENLYEIKSRSSQQLVFVAIVLLGLLGGKSAALVLTMSWFIFHKLIKSLWKI